MFNRQNSQPHCESCGRENPSTDEGYTTCCNELVCWGGQEFNWNLSNNKTIKACCSHKAEEKAPKGVYVTSRA